MVAPSMRPACLSGTEPSPTSHMDHCFNPCAHFFMKGPFVATSATLSATRVPTHVVQSTW